MKNKLLTLLLAIFISGFLACDEPGYNAANHNQHAQQHNYNQNETNPAGNPVNMSPREDGKEEIRDFWQRPEVIIQKMGNLTDKVVADIGAGPYGYFTVRIANKPVKKIIAMDIDKEAIQFIDISKISQDEEVRNRIETRLVEANDPKLTKEEADVALIVNTYVYFENPVNYLKNLKKGIAPNGKLVIVDFKKRTTSEGPPLSFRKAIGEVEQDLIEAGYKDIQLDDQSLSYQYIIVAHPGLPN